MNPNQLHISFENMEWESPQPGVLQKVVQQNNQKMRLLRFDDTFKEKDWCSKNHIGLVLEGEMKIDFEGMVKTYRKGDGLWITAGEASQHKLIMEPGQNVELLLFESED